MLKPPNPLKTPVLFLIFNRLEISKKVFEAIRQAKPPKLYIGSDGPRKERPDEEEIVNSVRDYILSGVDWECEIKTLFRKENLGCKYAVSEAISWFFEHEEQGIILEDDCLPSQSFFWFCEELLDKYKNDTRVFLISGYNKQTSWKPDLNDYFFSHFGGIWGWASWKRAWEKYDLEMTKLDEFKKRNYFKYLFGEELGKIRQKQMENCPSTTWDFQWGFARHMNSGLACVPAKSLIKNIGFGEGATHTQTGGDRVTNHEINFPLEENIFMIADKEYDKAFFVDQPLTSKIITKLSKILKNK